MNFYIVTAKNGKFQFNESELNVNDFTDNMIISGVSKYKGDIFITDELLRKIMNGEDSINAGGINQDWWSAQELIAAHFNLKAIEGHSLEELSDFSKVEDNESIKVLEFKLPSNRFGNITRIHFSDDISKNLVNAKTVNYTPNPVYD